MANPQYTQFHLALFWCQHCRKEEWHVFTHGEYYMCLQCRLDE